VVAVGRGHEPPTERQKLRHLVDAIWPATIEWPRAEAHRLAYFEFMILHRVLRPILGNRSSPRPRLDMALYVSRWYGSGRQRHRCCGKRQRGNGERRTGQRVAIGTTAPLVREALGLEEIGAVFGCS
jgi:hypothetical protein